MADKVTFATETTIAIRHLAAGLKERTAVEALDRTTADLRQLAELSGDPTLIAVSRDAQLAGALILAERVLNTSTLREWGYPAAAAEVGVLIARYDWRPVCTEAAVLLAAVVEDSPLDALAALAAEHERRDADDPGVRVLRQLSGALELWRQGYYRPKPAN